jgi:two-component system, NarL family, sensor histidine kinase BarA
MRSWKILNRLIFLAITPATCVAIFLTVYYSYQIINSLNEDVSKRGQALAAHLASASEQGRTLRNSALLTRLVDQAILEKDVVKIEIVGANGTVLHAAERLSHWEIPPNFLVHSITQLVYENAPVWFKTTITPSTDGSEPRHHGLAHASLPSSSAPLGFVAVSLTSEPTNYLATIVLVKGIAIVLVILGISSLFAISVGRSISTPLEQVSKTAHRIQEGRFEARVPKLPGAEFRALERGINQMAEQIQNSHAHLSKSVKLATTELNIKIREIKQKNRELEIARLRAEDANAAKSRFLANMSHELRTPMNAIIGFADLLSEFQVHEPHGEYVNTIRRSASDLLILINEILDYSKIESGELRIEKCEFNIYELIDDIINLLSPSAYEKNLDLLLFIDPDIPLELISDPQRLKQAIINLVSNAIKFTHKGYVSLELHHRQVDPPHNRAYLEVRIIDTGIGIDERDDDTVFKPFAQIDDSLTREYSGTGLGLSISKHFIERLNGEIGYSSKPNKGSTFWFTVPLVSKDPKLYHKILPLEHMPVLVYDRHPVRASYTRELLRTWGLRVKCSSKIDTFIDEYNSNTFKLVLYYLNQNEVDTDLQISINTLSGTAGVSKFFMHDSDFHEDRYSNTGYIHLSNVITPDQLFAHVYNHTMPPHGRRPTDSPAEQRFSAYNHNDLGQLTILIADDNEINQHLLQVYIARNNGNFITAHNGQEAIEWCRINDVDVVMMDVHMPKVDGIVAMQSIKNIRPDLPIIAVTADASSENLEKYINCGFDSCLTKPVTEKNMLTSILSVTSTRPSHSTPQRTDQSVMESEATQAEIPVIDLDKAVKISGGNRKLAHELFTMLIADLKHKRVQLNLHTQPDLEHLKELAHKIRGGAKYCAAEKVQITASRLEEATCRRDDDAQISVLTKRLFDAIQEILSMDDPYKSSSL